MDRNVTMQERSKEIIKEEKRIKALIATSIIMVLSMLVPGYKVFVICSVLWLISVFGFVFRKLNDSHTNIEKLWSDSFDQGVEYVKEKKFAQSSLYFIALPMCMVGMIFVFISLVLYFMK